MRVKRLEVQGFKSFKDKTVIHFDHGITGIVGPNGCGKSNIVDAFFWVMGEQSYKHMRGSGSEDLIFNGSSKYSPMGLAEATLVMERMVPDMTQMPSGATAADVPPPLKPEEISVTRRVHRSGEGEYFINGQHSRLKDIHELFMDTGVGAKGYSVIEQGQIDKVVNAKPEDRRLLIEEAAGIAKYKSRKKESLKKMESAQENLGRLTDLILEIERSVDSLDRQAQKARKYREYRDALQSREVTWGRRRRAVLQARVDALTTTRTEAEGQSVSAKAQLAGLEAGLETDRIRQTELRASIDALHVQYQSQSESLTQEKAALELSKKRREDVTQQLQTLEAEQARVQTSLDESQRALDQAQSQVEETEAQYGRISDERSDLEAEVGSLKQGNDQVARQAQSARTELMQLISRSAEDQAKLSGFSARQTALLEQRARIDHELKAKEDDLAVIEATTTTVETKLEALREELSTSRDHRRAMQEAIQTAKEAARVQEMATRQLSKDLTARQSRLETLKRLDQAGEGAAAGVQVVTQAKDSGLALWADLVQVKAGFEQELANWFDRALNTLIVPRITEVQATVEKLRGSKRGQATFLSIGTTESESADVVGALTTLGVTVRGRLTDFLEWNGASSEWSDSIDGLKALCKQVILVEDLSPLMQVQDLVAAGIRGEILSRTGECIRILPTGTEYVLGTRGESAAKIVLERRAEIQRLTTECKELQSQITVAEQAFADAEQVLAESTKSAEASLTQSQDLDLEVRSLERELQEKSQLLRSSKSRLDQLKSELKQLEQKETSDTQEQQATKQRLETGDRRREELEALLIELEVRVDAEGDKLSDRNQELQMLRVQEASVRERLLSLKRENSQALLQQNQWSQRLAELNQLVTRLSQEQTGTQASGPDQVREEWIATKTREHTQTFEQLSADKDEAEQVQSRLDAALSGLKQLHAKNEAFTRTLTESQVELERIQGELGFLTQNLDEKYGMGCLDQIAPEGEQQEFAESVVTAEMSEAEEQELHEAVESLRERIRRLGEVNLGAIEEYETVKARFDSLGTEKRDLEDSIKHLQEAIEKINVTSEDRFRKAFDAISDRFERLFPIVFGGGQAKLSLLYPEGSTDILEAGVDILAQPPGKKIVNMGLLSGGEKALTAISMIFAIFLVKPSPFCVLDEVDAPLDDSNIGKFNALLREMSAKSQFIVITHNKKTMELNDALYGVTMEEPGVSKMVSIQLH